VDRFVEVSGRLGAWDASAPTESRWRLALVKRFQKGRPSLFRLLHHPHLTKLEYELEDPQQA